MIRDDTVFLRHILDATNKIQEYTKGVDIAGVWDTAEQDIPALKNYLIKLL